MLLKLCMRQTKLNETLKFAIKLNILQKKKKKKKQFVEETLFSGLFSVDSWMFSLLHHISRHESQTAG